MFPFTGQVESIVEHLGNAQWWPADILRRRQLELLSPLVEHARRTVPYYRARLVELGLSSELMDAESRWQALPPMTRFDIQAAGEALRSEAVPKQHGSVTCKWTSGSTGAPVSVWTTELTRRIWAACLVREYTWQAYDSTGKLASIRCAPRGEASPPHGVELADWGLSAFGCAATGPGVVLDVRTTTTEQAEWLLHHQPNLLQTYPSVVYELAKHFLAARRELPSLRQVFTFGEILEPKVRQICRQAWGVEVLDSYSSTEVGYIASQCALGRGYHLHAEHLLVEILDDDAQPCEVGATGRVVITDLFNYAMPLLRYDIGDYAELGEPCPCGRKLPILRRILGRQRGMLRLPDGQRRWPMLENEAIDVFQGALPVRQFQIIQRSADEIEAKLVVSRPLAAQEEYAVRCLLAEWLGDCFQFRFTYVDSIPRGSTGKYEDFCCEWIPPEGLEDLESTTGPIDRT